MQRLQLLSRPGGPAVAAGYLNASVVAGEYRLYPATGTRARWVGREQCVRLLDGREVVLTVAEVRGTLRVEWLVAREV